MVTLGVRRDCISQFDGFVRDADEEGLAYASSSAEIMKLHDAAT